MKQPHLLVSNVIKIHLIFAFVYYNRNVSFEFEPSKNATLQSSTKQEGKEIDLDSDNFLIQLLMFALFPDHHAQPSNMFIKNKKITK